MSSSSNDTRPATDGERPPRRIAQRRAAGVDGDIDEFIIDNVVIQYKTAELSREGIFDVRVLWREGRRRVTRLRGDHRGP